MGTVIVLGIILCMVFFAGRKLYKNKKSGAGCGCGTSCSACSQRCSQRER